MPDHRSLIVDPAELLSRVPASGPLNEEQLILLAIANSPRLEGRRAEIAGAIAKRRDVKDLRNPELRLSYGSQDDDFLSDPYKEIIVEESNVTEHYNGTDSLTAVNDDGTLDEGNMTVDTNEGDTTSTRYRKIERQVTPRRDGGEKIEDTILRDERTDVTTGTRLREVSASGVPGTPLTQSVRETNTRRVAPGSIFTETTTGPGSANGRESFSAVVRLQMPHPFVKKAVLQRASAEIMLAEAKYLSDEDQLVRDVRDLFQSLGLLESTLAAQQKRRQNFTSLRAEMDTGEPAFAMDAARARIEMGGVYKDMRETGSDIDRTRSQLAKLCGLGNTSRIRTGGLITRRLLDLATLDPAYLVEMAMLYRADMVASRGNLEIAKAHLAEANAAKIPWATFIDGGWSRQWREANSGTQEEWMVRVGFEIPLFEWTGINKRSREYKKAAAAWEVQLEKQRNRISTEVDLALDHLRKSAAALRDHESMIRREKLGISKDLLKAEAVAVDPGDYARGKRFKYEAEDFSQQLEIGRYEAYDDYNKALMGLEDAIGVRVEKILNGWRDK